MLEELKMATMRWVERPRIYSDAVDAAKFQAGETVSESVIEDLCSPS
jgi:hypothetical protein